MSSAARCGGSTTSSASRLFVTHDQEEAFALADRVALLNEGRLEQFAAPAEIAAEPASAFVRSFLDWLSAPAAASFRAPGP